MDCEKCRCFINGACFYRGVPGVYCPCDFRANSARESRREINDDPRTLEWNGVSWSDFMVGVKDW